MPRPVKDVKEIWAENVLKTVRKALYKTHPRISKSEIDRQTRTAYKDRSKWIESSPFKVIVVVEPYGKGRQIYDPYDYDPPEIKRLNKAAEILRADPFIDDAGWESYNAAILYFWIDPKMIS